jgi:hypothetical protein
MSSVNVDHTPQKQPKEQGKFTAKVVKEFSTPHKAELNTLAMAPNSKYILTCSTGTVFSLPPLPQPDSHFTDETVVLWSVPHANLLEQMNVKKGCNYMHVPSSHASRLTATQQGMHLPRFKALRAGHGYRRSCGTFNAAGSSAIK